MTDIPKAARVIEALIFASPAPVARRALLPYVENEEQITDVITSIAARYDDALGLSSLKQTGITLFGHVLMLRLF